MTGAAAGRYNENISTGEVGDLLELKKPHPCGSRRWLVLRVGMDFKLRCAGCGHELMLPRSKAEKAVKKIIPKQEADT